MSVFSNRKQLNFRSKLTKDFYVRIIESPRLWMSDKEIESLVADIKTIAVSAQLQNLDYGLFKDQDFFLKVGLFTVIYEISTNSPVGFSSQTKLACTLRGQEVSVYHAGLAVMNPAYQSKGLSRSLYGLTTFLVFFKNKLKPIWVSSVTQVPAVFGGIVESFTDVYPSGAPAERPSFDQTQIAVSIMKNYRHVFGVGAEADFDDSSFVITNAYTGGSDGLKKTFEQCPKHRNQDYNNYCESKLNYQRGDDFLQIGQMSLLTYFKYLTHHKDEDSNAITFYKIIFLICEGFVVPIMGWFSTGKVWKTLRPRR